MLNRIMVLVTGCKPREQQRALAPVNKLCTESRNIWEMHSSIFTLVQQGFDIYTPRDYGHALSVLESSFSMVSCWFHVLRLVFRYENEALAQTFGCAFVRSLFVLPVSLPTPSLQCPSSIYRWMTKAYLWRGNSTR